MSSQPEHVDVLIVGAGLSGIGAACQLRRHLPSTSVVVLEARDASGGTWDLFTYPGIRSDSDMFTFGYRWRPWLGARALAEGSKILTYLRTVAQEYRVDELIRYRHKVISASWDSDAARWKVRIQSPDPAGEVLEMTAGLLWSCAGYYDYQHPYLPEFPGVQEFAGPIIHPQHRPEDLDYRGKRVVVIGSGATAVTVVPAMAESAAHVTMLQRSPSYILSRPARDKLSARLDWLPARLTYPVIRWTNIVVSSGFYRAARWWPGRIRKWLHAKVVEQLPESIDADQHFQPRYDPWDERVCFVPDGDLFRALRAGTASVVTDTIDTFTPTGIRLCSGKELEADIIVSATGLRLLPFGGIALDVDGQPVELARTLTYKGLMLSGVPNFVYTVGYTNASWTLKADLVCDYVIRLIRHMRRRGARSAVPVREPGVGERPFLDLRSGYVMRGVHHLPKQGDRRPWRMARGYIGDLRSIRHGRVDDGVLAFDRVPGDEVAAAVPTTAATS